MYYSMDSFKYYGVLHQRALRVKPFKTLDSAIKHAQKNATGNPFVTMGVKVVWVR